MAEPLCGFRRSDCLFSSRQRVNKEQLPSGTELIDIEQRNVPKMQVKSRWSEPVEAENG